MSKSPPKDQVRIRRLVVFVGSDVPAAEVSTSAGVTASPVVSVAAVAA